MCILFLYNCCATPTLSLRHGKNCANAVISLFAAEDEEGFGEIGFHGSGDDLGMEDEEDNDSEPEFEFHKVIQKKATMQ